MARRRSLFNYERWCSMSEEEQIEWFLDQHDQHEQEAKRREKDRCIPYELFIYVKFTEEIVEYLKDHHNPWHSYHKIVNKQIYYNWFDSKEEALAKFDEKIEQYVKPILESKYYHCWPSHNITIKLTKGSNIIKEEYYEIN